MNKVYPPSGFESTAQTVPSAMHRYADFDQFVLIDDDGFSVSSVTSRRCNPFKKKNQQSLAAVLRAVTPELRLGFVLSKGDPFFFMVVKRRIRGTAISDWALNEFSTCGVTESPSGDIQIVGTSCNIPRQTRKNWTPGFELYTRNFVLDMSIVAKTLTTPFSPAGRKR